MALFKVLSDKWAIEDHCKWNHDKMLRWISSLNTSFCEQYSDSFTIAKVDGTDFQLLSDTEYLIFVLTMNERDASSFSNIIMSRMENYNRNKNQIQKQSFESHNYNESFSPKQEYSFLNKNKNNELSAPLQTKYSTTSKISVSPSPSPPLQSMQPNHAIHINTNVNDFSDGPALPPSKSILLEAIQKKNLNIIDSEDDDLYNEYPETPKANTTINTTTAITKINSYDGTPQGPQYDDLMSDSDNETMYEEVKEHETKRGSIHVQQSSTELSSPIDLLNDINHMNYEYKQRNSLSEIHKNNRGIAQLLITNNDNDFKQFDIRINECQKLWNKHCLLDANIQYINTYDNNDKIKSITLHTLKKLEQLLIVIGGREVVESFFNIDSQISQTCLRSLIISAHTNASSNNEDTNIFYKLKNTPNVTHKDYNIMVSINFDISYVVITQNENKYKQTLKKELALILGIHKSFINIMSSTDGFKGYWHVDVNIIMWSYLYSLKAIQNLKHKNRNRNIFKYKFKMGDLIDVCKGQKWYVCKIKAITMEDKSLHEKGENVRIGYIGKYIERNGQIIKEMGKPFKLKNTQKIWSIADKHRIRVKQLNVDESITNQFLKIAFKHKMQML